MITGWSKRCLTPGALTLEGVLLAATPCCSSLCDQWILLPASHLHPMCHVQLLLKHPLPQGPSRAAPPHTEPPSRSSSPFHCPFSFLILYPQLANTAHVFVYGLCPVAPRMTAPLSSGAW